MSTPCVLCICLVCKSLIKNVRSFDILQATATNVTYREAV